MINRHQLTIAQYPHFPLGKGVPYEGIENLRPESIATREVFASWNKAKSAQRGPFLPEGGPHTDATSASKRPQLP